MSKEDFEKQIKQNLMQKDKEVIVDLYLQMKYERDINCEQLESTKKLHECERFYLVNQARQFDEMRKNSIKQVCEKIRKKFTEEYLPFYLDDTAIFRRDALLKVLDQIEKGEDDEN